MDISGYSLHTNSSLSLVGCGRQAATRLCAGLADAHPVTFGKQLTVHPSQHLQAAARATFEYLLTSFAFSAKVAPLALTAIC